MSDRIKRERVAIKIEILKRSEVEIVKVWATVTKKEIKLEGELEVLTAQ
jgi:hypothetical protein